MASHKKRERTQNWSLDEKVLLLKLCGDKIHILESKKADQYSLAVKMNIWKQIHKEFTKKLRSDRDILRIKEQWQRMKKQAKSELQEFKLQNSSNQVLPKKISNISEEVLKIMERANRNDAEDDDEEDDENDLTMDYEQDNMPTYFCETEVNQEDEEEKIVDYLENEEDSSPVNNHLTQNHDRIFDLLENICNDDLADVDKKLKFESKDELNVQLLLLAKQKEHQKRMQLLDEQLKTAKIQKETAEINKQIAQQELKHVLLQSNNIKEKKLMNGAKEIKKEHCETNDKETEHKINFHHNVIYYHEEEIVKHKKHIEDLVMNGNFL